MYQPLIKFHPHPAIFTQVLRIFVKTNYALWIMHYELNKDYETN